MDPKLITAINTMPDPGYDSENGHFHNKYASLGAVTKTIKDHLKDHGFAIIQLFDGTDLVTQVVGISGEPEMESRFTIPFDKATGNNYWQVIGQGMTYVRRYVLCAMFCLVAGDVDDDAQLETWYQQQARAEQAEDMNKNDQPRGPVVL